MKLIQHTSELLCESYYEATLDCGLRLFIYPKPQYSSAYAVFGTRYGSVDTKFRRVGEQEYTEVPEGIAHFLEHKLFESEEQDAFERFAKTGASANAYTSFDRTCYLFGCSSKFEENLDILLDFVQHPYFTAQSVEKEQGIIGQEIRMYDDEPGWRVMFNLLALLYERHPVKIDIAGTVESIAEIDADLLYRCYEVFYNPSNMFICIAGNVDAQQVAERIEAALPADGGVAVERGTVSEPAAPVGSYAELTMSVSQPMFCMGFKEQCEGEVPLRDYVATTLLLDILAGEWSPLFARLLDEGLIGDSMGTEFFNGPSYAAELFDGESRDPQAVKSALLEELARLRRDGIDEADFIRAKRSYYGRTVGQFGGVEDVGSALVAAAVGGYELYDTLEVVRSITLEEVTARLNCTMLAENFALSVILPDAGGKN